MFETPAFVFVTLYNILKQTASMPSDKHKRSVQATFCKKELRF
jgi:hypothetical protein